LLTQIFSGLSLAESTKNINEQEKVKRMDKLSYAKQVSEKYWIKEGNGPDAVKGRKTKIMKIGMIEGAEFDNLLKGFSGFFVLLYNPISVIAGPSQKAFSLFLKDDKQLFIGDSDDELISFFVETNVLRSKNKQGIQHFLELFARLRSYKIAPQGHKKSFPSIKWETEIIERNGGWEAKVTYLTDDGAISIARYKFLIDNDGNVTFEVLEGSSLRHYS
jgi:hypothetical protein